MIAQDPGRPQLCRPPNGASKEVADSRFRRILPFRSPRRRRGPDRVDEDGFIIDDDDDGMLTYPFGGPSVGLEMDFEHGVSATLTVSISDVAQSSSGSDASLRTTTPRRDHLARSP